jgi:hypothetical protein
MSSPECEPCEGVKAVDIIAVNGASQSAARRRHAWRLQQGVLVAILGEARLEFFHGSGIQVIGWRQ